MGQLRGIGQSVPLLDLNPLPFSLNPRTIINDIESGVSNFFNPFQYLAALLRDLFSSEGAWGQWLLMKIPFNHQFTWILDLRMNAEVIAPTIAVGVAIVAFAISIAWPKRAHWGPLAFGYAVALAWFEAVWFVGCGVMLQANYSASNWIRHWYLPHAQHDSILMSIPSIDSITNFAGLISALLWVMTVTFGLVILVAWYWVLNICIQLLGLIVFALLFTGERAKNWCDTLISFAVVSMLLSRPIAVLFLEIARYVVLRAPGGNWPIMDIMYYSLFVGLAAGLEIWLPFLIRNQVAKVTGQLKAAVVNEIRSRTNTTVRGGRIEATTRKPLSARLAQGAAFHETINARAVQYAGGPPRTSHKTQAFGAVLAEFAVAKAVQKYPPAAAAHAAVKRVRATRERTRRGQTNGA